MCAQVKKKKCSVGLDSKRVPMHCHLVSIIMDCILLIYSVCSAKLYSHKWATFRTNNSNQMPRIKTKKCVPNSSSIQSNIIQSWNYGELCQFVQSNAHHPQVNEIASYCSSSVDRVWRRYSIFTTAEVFQRPACSEYEIILSFAVRTNNYILVFLGHRPIVRIKSLKYGAQRPMPLVSALFWAT